MDVLRTRDPLCAPAASNPEAAFALSITTSVHSADWRTLVKDVRSLYSNLNSNTKDLSMEGGKDRFDLRVKRILSSVLSSRTPSF